ncbi:MAG: rod shape-determining protein [Acetobacteraceae bacterium]|nr:rod shape-determining protein [Acetobacteraceae bacterium]
MLATDIGVDLGTANSLIHVKGRGIVLREPSVVAVDKATGRMLAVGEEARRMLGRTPGNIVAIRPLRDGVIADYDMTEMMLRYFLARVCGRRMLFRPRVMVCVPSGVTTVERRAVLEAAMEAGARKTYLIEEPLAAALGADLDIWRPSGCMVADVGGGTTDVAVLSLGGVVISETLRVGGDKFDDAIVRHVKREYNLMIGESTAEEVKIQAGTAFPGSREKTIEVRGRDLLSGLPKTITLTSREVCEALQEPITQVVDLLRSVLERTPPELAADILDKGLVLSGGGALLDGLDKLITRETSVPCHLADDPLSCVALGTGRALENLERLKDILSLSS